MDDRIRQLLDLTDDLLVAASVEEDRIPMEGYMKNHFQFYGVKSPARKIVLSKVKPHLKTLTSQDIFTFVEALWEHPNRESQYMGLDILAFRKKMWDSGYLPRVEKLILTKSWWDTVDGLAPNIVGAILCKSKEVKLHWIEKWNNDANIWLNRSALIHQLWYKEAVDLDLLFALVDSHIESKEFFINKAAGWALRQASKYYPSEVSEYINGRPNLSNLTKREGSKYL